MASDDRRFVKLDDDPEHGPSPAESERVLVGPIAGAVAGLVVGLVLLFVADRAGTVGDSSNPATLFGLPLAGAVIGLMLGLLLSVVGRSTEDAPVRDRRYLHRRHAATPVSGDDVDRAADHRHVEHSPDRR
jgi:hypothetical protein